VAKFAAGLVHIVTLGIYSGIKARRQAAREEAKRVQDELVELREKLERLTKEARSR